MSKEVATKEQSLVVTDWTPEQVKLIADTVAKNATLDELKLFLYRCKTMGLDPLRPGTIYFIKYNQSSPGTIVVGLDGFRAIAARTGKHIGTTRGIVRDAEGRCIGAWAEVHRSDWKHPAREEVSFAEYNTGKAQWAKMPETMIKKVAESAALRMAFPDDLGGLYSQDEMHQAEHKAPHTEPHSAELPLPNGEPRDLGDYVIPVTNKFHAKRLKEITVDELSGMVKWYMDKIASGATFGPKHHEFIDRATQYIETQSAAQVPAKDHGDGVPF